MKNKRKAFNSFWPSDYSDSFDNIASSYGSVAVRRQAKAWININLSWVGPHEQISAALAWWRHQMETFSALLATCVGSSPVTEEFPSQRPVTRSFNVFFDLRLNKQLSKQSWGWWFETPSRPLWRRCSGIKIQDLSLMTIHLNLSLQNGSRSVLATFCKLIVS